MSLKTNMAVRLRADSTLLYIEAIDEEKAIAFCSRFGDSGPEGEAKPYLLDALRENVVRAFRKTDPQVENTVLSRMLCWVGAHGWQLQTVQGRRPLGNIEAMMCMRCGETRLRD